MAGAKVPADDFMKHDTDDSDDRYSIRRPLGNFPSAALEEAVGATVLRFAKEKFESRTWEEVEAGDDLDVNDGDDDDGGLSEPESLYSTEDATSRTSRSRSRSRAASAKRESRRTDEATGDDRMDTDSEISAAEEETKVPLGKRTLEPAVATDDQLSYDLMRPAVRNILAKLDATLVVLHKSRDATIKYMSSSSDESELSDATTRSRTSRSRVTKPPAKKRRGRPPKAGLAFRLRTPPPMESGANPTHDSDQGVAQGATSSTAAGQDESPKKKVGRPKKVYPRLEGESDREWAIRVARLRKQPVPIFRDELESEDPKSSNSEAQPRKPCLTDRKPMKSRERSPEGSPSKQRRNHKTARRLRLRDWKDILGAAALAGFPPAALDRAARRCANLFGESMEMRTLAEGPLGQAGGIGGTLDRVVQYQRGMAGPEHAPGELSELEGDGGDGGSGDEDDETRSQSAARHLRASSLASEDARGRPRGRTVRSRSRSASTAAATATARGSRSRSLSAAACAYFCPVRACPRAVEGFARRPNLRRHLKLVHGIVSDAAAQPQSVDVDSEDEMLGAVHVDGFLRPIRIRKGWRGAGAEGPPSKRRRYGGSARQRRGGRDGGSVAETGDDGYQSRDVAMDDH
jgi:hypothetical protein